MLRAVTALLRMIEFSPTVLTMNGAVSVALLTVTAPAW